MKEDEPNHIFNGKIEYVEHGPGRESRVVSSYKDGKMKPTITHTVYPEEYGTYSVGDKVTLGGLTFKVSHILSATKVQLRVHATGWERFKSWLKVKSTFPTWMLARAFTPMLPESHPWSGKKFTQIEWYAGATSDCKWISISIWVMVTLNSLILIRLWSKQ